MSDMGDLFREMREEKQARRHANMVKARTEMEADRDDWTMHNSSHYSRDLCGDKLQYWPSANKWHWNKRTYHGTYSDLKAFIRNRQS